MQESLAWLSMERYIYRSIMMTTPFFPALRVRLAAMGRRQFHALRQLHFPALLEELRQWIPPQLLASEEQGPNSRDRVFSLRLTFECFVWQMLKPRTSCREVTRQVQALLRLHGRSPIDEDDSAYVQARQRLPQERFQKALSGTAQVADRRVRRGGQLR